MFHSQPVPEELQNGEGFGYIIAFRPVGTVTWTRAVISAPSLTRYVFRNDTIPPFSPFNVKVGAFNNRGEGPFSSITTVFSAEEGTDGFIYIITHNHNRLHVESRLPNTKPSVCIDHFTSCKQQWSFFNRKQLFWTSIVYVLQNDHMIMERYP